MKKLMLILMACLVVVSFSAANTADAAPKRGGSSYKAPSKSYTPTAPAKDSGVSKTDPAKSGTAGTGSTTANRGFMSGGGFMKGMMIGGLAGLMFGGLFGGMGMFGNLLGMLVNVLAIIVVIMIVARIFAYFRDRKNAPPKKRFQE